MIRLFRAILFGALLLLAPSWLRALDGPTEFTMDLPFGDNQATPAWLGHPATPSGTFATLDLPITPPDATSSLLLTIFYQEETGGFLRISWQDSAIAPTPAGQLPGPGEVGASSVLCDNFYEGIGMNNQRSLLVPADAVKLGGILHFQTGDSMLGISRIKLEWLESSTGLSSPAITDVLVTPANGRTQVASELAGAPATATDPAWHDRVVDVPVTDVALRIEQGVDFTVRMDSVPALARLSLKEAGLSWGQHLVVWMNNQRAGVIYPTVPSLDDAGYTAGSAGAPYIGWREGSFLVPLADLTSGDNVLQFSTEPDDAPATPADPNAAAAPLALKDVCVQLDYPPASAAVASAVPATASPAPAPNVAPSALNVPVSSTPTASTSTNPSAP
jgi:hypothetical protein